MSKTDEIINDVNLTGKIRELIIESNERCKARGLDTIKINKLILNDKDLKEKLNKSAQLIKVSSPIINNMYKIVKGSGFVITLTDSEGYIINIVGDEEIVKESAEIYFVKGSLWTEETVGTNGIAIVLKNDIPVQIIGKEHYCKIHHDWTCSAAPIHDEFGKMIGCLNLSGKSHKAHKHTLGMVLTATYSIERQLYLEKSNSLLTATFQSISDGMIVLNNEFKVENLNQKASEILGYTKTELMGKNIKEIIKDVKFIEKVFKTGEIFYDVDCDINMNYKKIKCVVNIVPISSKYNISGVVFTFNTSKIINKVVNKVVGNRAIYNFEDILTENCKMKALIEYTKKVAKSDANVLVTGESGTGKELFAHSIHNYSDRRNEPFVAINCASIPKELLESELFGYEKGAFTGAGSQGHIGKFELGDGGTIFLDEIGEMPLDMQAKLLRVLDNKMISRVGGNYERFINIRVIAATNRNLIEEVKKNKFRMDLYYRLNVLNIKTIPLRERKDDIKILAKNFMRILNEKNNTDKELSEEYIRRLMAEDWEGNVRELKNEIERAYFLSENSTINDNGFIQSLNEEMNNNEWNNFIDEKNIINIETIEMENLKKALNQCNNNVIQAAELLGIGKSTFYRKIKKYNIYIKDMD